MTTYPTMMSNSDAATQHSHNSLLPRIHANQRTLSAMFSSLSLTVFTAGKPYFEVLLTTDRSLFLDTNRSKRNSSNFFSSRTDVGLRVADSSQANFITPSAVLLNFASAKPRPTEIFYAVAVSQTLEGREMIYSASPETLATSARSVTLASDFDPDTFSRSLGIRAHRLSDRVHVTPAPTIPALQALSDEVEDGYAQNSRSATLSLRIEDGGEGESLGSQSASLSNNRNNENSSSFAGNVADSLSSHVQSPQTPSSHDEVEDGYQIHKNESAFAQTHDSSNNPDSGHLSSLNGGRRDAHSSGANSLDINSLEAPEYEDSMSMSSSDRDQRDQTDQTEQYPSFGARGASTASYVDSSHQAENPAQNRVLQSQPRNEPRSEQEDGYRMNLAQSTGRSLATEDEIADSNTASYDDPDGDYAQSWNSRQQNDSDSEDGTAMSLGAGTSGTRSSHTNSHSVGDGDSNSLDYDDGYGALEADEPAATLSHESNSEEPSALLANETDYDGTSTGELHDIGEPVAISHSAGYGDEADGWEAVHRTPFRPVPAQQPTTPRRPFDIAARLAIIEKIGHYESGSAGYSAVGVDNEFRAVGHPAYHRYHLGLSYGIIMVTQESGALGRLLLMMRHRDTATFDRIFGPSADTLLRVTNASGPHSKDSPDGRSARIQPVDGKDLWEEPWLTRFTQAGSIPLFQAAQNQYASEHYIDPILRFASWLGLNTDRALALVADRSVQMGVADAKRWILDSLGLLQTSAQRDAALHAVRQPSLLAFQRATPGLNEHDHWDADTQAAMIAALRHMGHLSPLPIPGRNQILDTLERHASQTSFIARVRDIRRSREYAEIEFEF